MSHELQRKDGANIVKRANLYSWIVCCKPSAEVMLSNASRACSWHGLCRPRLHLRIVWPEQAARRSYLYFIPQWRKFSQFSDMPFIPSNTVRV